MIWISCYHVVTPSFSASFTKAKRLSWLRICSPVLRLSIKASTSGGNCQYGLFGDVGWIEAKNCFYNHFYIATVIWSVFDLQCCPLLILTETRSGHSLNLEQKCCSSRSTRTTPEVQNGGDCFRFNGPFAWCQANPIRNPWPRWDCRFQK